MNLFCKESKPVEQKKEEGMYFVASASISGVEFLSERSAYSRNYPINFKSLERAKQSAEVAAKKHPGTEYYVLGVMGKVTSKYNPPDPPKWEIG